jgi:hypothetical protein
MRLTLSRQKYNQIQIDKLDGVKLVCRYSAKFNTDDHYRKASKALSVASEALYEAVAAFEAGDDLPSSVELPADPATIVLPFVVTLRGRVQTETGAESFANLDPVTAFLEALHHGTGEPTRRAETSIPANEIPGSVDEAVNDAGTAARRYPTETTIIAWTGRDKLCALDIDFHGIPIQKRPDHSRLQSIMTKVRPTPLAYWLTHGRGYRLIFAAGDGYTADEIAAIAAIAIRHHEKLAECELLTSTRLPPGPFVLAPQLVDLTYIKRWFTFTEFDPETVADWLDKKGLEIGRRYPHSQCPIAPDGGGERDPVQVFDNHVRCYVCQGKGRAFGHHLPGVFPFTALAGTPVATHLRLCVTQFTHWEHAKYIVDDSLKFSGDIAKLAYSAALKSVHGTADPRIPAAFLAGRNFVRFESRWSDLRGQTWTKDVSAELRSLPTCQHINEAGELKTREERVCRLSQPIDLTTEGYPPLEPIWGARIYSEYLELRNPSRVNVVIQNATLSAPQVASSRPRYIAAHKRPFDEARAWEVLEAVVPGINRNAVKCYIAARGVSEADIGTPPMVFCSGPSKSAKSMTVVVAAAICGDNAQSITGSVLNEERTRQGILEAKDKGTFAVFNEAMKRAKRGKISPIEIMNFVLNLTADSVSHKLYVGPVALGRMPVCVFTDTHLPEELYRDTQIARRIVHIHMPGKVDWESRFRESGAGQPHQLRLASPEIADACNVILSAVIDEFFRVPQTFHEIAAALGFRTLTESQTADDSRGQLVEFFKAVCDAPAVESASDRRRWKGRGWKVIDHGQNDLPIVRAWYEVSDEKTDGDFTKSRRCGEVDWAELLGAGEPLEMEISAHSGTKIAVRFVNVNRTRKSYRVNEEIADASAMELELESEPAGDSANRLGNAVGREFEACREQCLPNAPDDAVAITSGDAR